MAGLGYSTRILACILGIVLWAGVAIPAPYAAMVMDARTGKVLHARNADTKLHPASLTKMMTLYVAFEAVERGEISLDTRVTISRLAASEPPSKLGLRRGQKIALRYLIRAAAVRSANDAATAIGVAISGSEKAFARRMTRTARAMGMKNTTFRNAHGLTQSGHVSTARDMTILGRHILYDYPEYYNLFSRRSTDAGVGTVRNTNRRFLANYRGADGIKTGFTRAAGYNLVASAERGKERIIATMFGGKSVSHRNQQVARLLDMGFSRAPTTARLRKPRIPAYSGPAKTVRVAAAPAPKPAAAKTIRLTTAVKRSLRPQARPFDPPVTAETILAVADATTVTDAVQVALKTPDPTPKVTNIVPTFAPDTVTKQPVARPAPEPKPEPTMVAVKATVPVDPTAKNWAINIGKYPSWGQAERVLVRTALAEMVALDGAERRIKQRSQGFDALFTGMTRDRADLACRRLQAQQITCLMISPG